MCIFIKVKMHALVSHTRILMLVFETLVSQQSGRCVFRCVASAAHFFIEVNDMGWSAGGTSFLDQVKNVILTDRESVVLRERFEQALAKEISVWVLEDWEHIQRCILNKAAKREFSVERDGTRITGEVLFDGAWRKVKTPSLRGLYEEIKSRELLPHYFDVSFSGQDVFSMRLCLKEAQLSSEGDAAPYRVCAKTAHAYVVQMLELARRNDVQMICCQAPVCIDKAVGTMKTCGNQALCFSYSITV